MKKIDSKIYDLIPPQEMIQFMLKYSFFHKQVTQIPESIIVDKEIDFDLMKKAINIEIERNDCMRLRFFKQKGKVKQYFLEKYELTDIPVLKFSSADEQMQTLTADAQTPVRIFKDETFRIRFFITSDGRYGIYICVHHLIMDNAACLMFFNDLLAVYDHLKDGAPMPKPLGRYEDRIIKELAYIADKSNLEKEEKAYTEYITKNGDPMYLGVEGPKFLEAERKKKKDPTIMAPSLFDPIHDKAAFTKKALPPEEGKKVIEFMDKYGVSGECLIQLAMRLYLSKINGGYLDTYFITLCPRRKTLSEKRSGGTVTAPLPWRLTLTEDTTFMQALAQMAEIQVWAFRHMDYPYLEYRELQRKLFNYPAAAGSSTMMFSWFPLEENTMNNWNYEFVGYGIGRYVMVLYTFAMKDVKNNTIKITYQHRTKFVSVEDIEKFHAGTEKVLKLCVENPELTVKQILEKI